MGLLALREFKGLVGSGLPMNNATADTGAIYQDITNGMIWRKASASDATGWSLELDALNDLARRDAELFAGYLLLNSGTDIYANGQIDNYISFAQTLYAQAGRRVDFLCLPNTQNMASGTVVFSFLCQRFGVVGSPTFGSTGITLDGSSQYLTGKVNTGVSGSTARSLISVNTATSGSRAFLSHGAVTGAGLSEVGYLSGLSVLNTMPTTPDYVDVNVGTAPTASQFTMYFGGMDGVNNNVGHSKDFTSYRTLLASVAGNTVNSKLEIGRRIGSTNWNPGIHALAILAPAYFNLADYQAINTAYKAGLGSGLSMP